MKNPTEKTIEEGQSGALALDALLGELEYIAASPAQEHGGFHPRVVAAASAAKAEILRMRLKAQADAEWGDEHDTPSLGDAIHALAIVRGQKSLIDELGAALRALWKAETASIAAFDFVQVRDLEKAMNEAERVLSFLPPNK